MYDRSSRVVAALFFARCVRVCVWDHVLRDMEFHVIDDTSAKFLSGQALILVPSCEKERER